MEQTSQCESPCEVEPVFRRMTGAVGGWACALERNNVKVASIRPLFPSRRESKGRADQLGCAVLLRRLFKGSLFFFCFSVCCNVCPDGR